MEFSLVYVTAENHAQAISMAQVLVQEHLAACVNVVDGMTSVYRWEGKVQQGREALLLIKTRSENTSKIISKIQEIHSYSCPCVTVLPITGGNPDFLDWIKSETSAA